MYVSDTHSLIWHLTEDERLGSQAKVIFEEADKGNERIVLPTVALAEALYISREDEVSFEKLIRKIDSSINYEVYPLNMQVILEMEDLDPGYSIHDSAIVATARILGFDVITKDSVIQSQGDVETVWG